MTDVSCFYLRVPQITPALCQRTKAPCFIVLLRPMERKSAVCSYTEAGRGNGNRFDSRDHCQQFVLGSVSLVLPFLNVYVNNRDTKTVEISTQLRKNVQWCLKAKRYN